MAYPNNFIVSYDINGLSPTHSQMDQHISRISGKVHRILETVWLVHTSWTLEVITKHINDKLTSDDSLMVVEAKDMKFRNLLVSDTTVQKTWSEPDYQSEIIEALLRQSAPLKPSRASEILGLMASQPPASHPPLPRPLPRIFG